MNAQMLNGAAALYFILAIGYNLASLASRDMNRAPLAPTEPVQAIVMMSLLYVIYASEEVLGSVAWTALIAVFLILIVRFGIYRHLAGYSPADYASRTAWAAAIGINVYGVCVLCLALLLREAPGC